MKRKDKIKVYLMNHNRYINSKLYAEIKSRKKCSKCGKKRKKGVMFEVHHVVPLSEGGDNKRNNLILVCPECHDKLHGRNKAHADGDCSKLEHSGVKRQ